MRTWCNRKSRTIWICANNAAGFFGARLWLVFALGWLRSLLVSCFCAYAVAESLKDLPIYEALLERDLRRHGNGAALAQPVVMDFIIQPQSAFAGQEARSLGLPAGCILVRCADGKREWIPKANTRLLPHMRITAVIAPEASSGLEMLRKCCKGEPE